MSVWSFENERWFWGGFAFYENQNASVVVLKL
jgi:hypothetical protein